MTSDDALAGAAILVGALLSTLATISLVGEIRPAEAPAPWIRQARPPGEAPVVDFAIIRGEVELMVGPEGPHSGWHGEGLSFGR